MMMRKDEDNGEWRRGGTENGAEGSKKELTWEVWGGVGWGRQQPRYGA